MNKIQSIAVLGAVFAAASPVFAQAPIIVETSPTRVVSYADLDVTSPAGIATLQGRVRRAANELCTISGEGFVILDERMDKRRCLQSALASAQPQLQQLASRSNGPQYAGRSVIRVSRR